MGGSGVARLAADKDIKTERAITGGMTFFLIGLLVVYLAITLTLRVRAYVQEWRYLNVLVARLGLVRQPFESNGALRRRYLHEVVKPISRANAQRRKGALR